MSADNELTTRRLQMLDNGFSPIPNRDKACYMHNWPKMMIDETAIKRWSRMHNIKATGLRVENGLCVIDVDIDHNVVDDVADAMLAVLPDDLHPERLERHGKGRKFAWYCRTDDVFSRLHTRRWTAPDETVDDGTHSVEIFGGGSSRQFGSDGVHSFKDNGEVAVTYKWVGDAPWDVPLRELSVITKDQAFAMLDAAEEVLKHNGFEAVKRTEQGESIPRRVYDLTDDMVFDLFDGRSVMLDELSVMVKNGYTGRCSAAWQEGPSAVNRRRCLIRRSGTGHVQIWESASDTTHLPADIMPRDSTSQVDQIAEKISERRVKMVADDNHITAAAKLRVSYAWMPTSKLPVVPLWSISDEDRISLVNFRISHLPYCGVEIGARGAEKRINPVDLWLSNPKRIVVQGTRMRPDRARPIFEEHGYQWLNTYRPPNLGSHEGGKSNGGIDLIEQLVPDPRERLWFLQWLAYKWRYPHVPGPAVIMVARDFGTGRGTLGALLKLLFGNHYVVNVPFSIFAGLSYQSQYTDWGLDALFAIVNESSAAGDRSTYRTKHDVYEHLKEIVEPRAVERTFIRKGEGSVRAVASTSYLIMTNNPDALPLPEDDRRFAVLTNGEVRDPEFWQYINNWMQQGVNIAAFAEYLETVDITSYDPYAPPLSTIAKVEMHEYSQSLIGALIVEALDDMDGFFTPEHVIRRVTELGLARKIELPDKWKSIAMREIRRIAYTVRYENGRKVSPQIGSRRYDVMHMDRDTVKKFTGVSAAELRRLLWINGNIFGVAEHEKDLSERLTSHLRVVLKDDFDTDSDQN